MKYVGRVLVMLLLVLPIGAHAAVCVVTGTVTTQTDPNTGANDYVIRSESTKVTVSRTEAQGFLKELNRATEEGTTVTVTITNNAVSAVTSA